MSINKALLTTAFVSTLALSGAATANENPISNIISNMMQNVVVQTADDIELEIQKSIIELGHFIELNTEVSLSNEVLPKTSVTITDLPSIESQKTLTVSE